MTPASIYALQRAITTMIDNPTARTATFNGTAFDLLDYEGDALLGQLIGAVSGTAPTLDGVFNESDTSGGTYAAIVSGAVTFTQVIAANSLQTRVIRTGECKRFVRHSATIAGTTPSFNTATFIVGRKKYET